MTPDRPGCLLSWDREGAVGVAGLYSKALMQSPVGKLLRYTVGEYELSKGFKTEQNSGCRVQSPTVPGYQGSPGGP